VISNDVAMNIGASRAARSPEPRAAAGQTRALRSGAAKCGAGHVVIVFTVD